MCLILVYQGLEEEKFEEKKQSLNLSGILGSLSIRFCLASLILRRGAIDMAFVPEQQFCQAQSKLNFLKWHYDHCCESKMFQRKIIVNL